MKHKNFTCGHDPIYLTRNKKHDAFFCAEIVGIPYKKIWRRLNDGWALDAALECRGWTLG